MFSTSITEEIERGFSTRTKLNGADYPQSEVLHFNWKERESVERSGEMDSESLCYDYVRERISEIEDWVDLPLELKRCGIEYFFDKFRKMNKTDLDWVCLPL